MAIIAYLSGEFSRKMELKTDEQHKTEVMQFLRATFPDRSIPDPLKFSATRWCQEEFSRGTYTFMATGTSLDTLEELRTPVIVDGVGPVLYLAGEHTCSGLEPGLDIGTARVLEEAQC